MIIEKISQMFENGHIGGLSNSVEINNIDWIEHSMFKGVYLKHLIKGIDTNGSLSCHLVKVNPGCTLDTHFHNGKLEVHEIIEGTGTCIIKNDTLNYKPGSVALIPPDTNHKVVAGSEGLFILAKFSPALL